MFVYFIRTTLTRSRKREGSSFKNRWQPFPRSHFPRVVLLYHKLFFGGCICSLMIVLDIFGKNDILLVKCPWNFWSLNFKSQSITIGTPLILKWSTKTKNISLLIYESLIYCYCYVQKDFGAEEHQSSWIIGQISECADTLQSSKVWRTPQ